MGSELFKDTLLLASTDHPHSFGRRPYHSWLSDETGRHWHSLSLKVLGEGEEYEGDGAMEKRLDGVKMILDDKQSASLRG